MVTSRLLTTGLIASTAAEMNRRRFLFSTLGAGTLALGGPWLSTAGATEEELAFANFGASVELLAKDFYTRALGARIGKAGLLREGRAAAARHAKALSNLLVAAGDVAPSEADFAFRWPAATFRTSRAATATGLTILRALGGAYQTAGATVTEPSYRVLYASLAGSVGQQIGGLLSLTSRSEVDAFPVAMALESATNAAERYLG